MKRQQPLALEKSYWGAVASCSGCATLHEVLLPISIPEYHSIFWEDGTRCKVQSTHLLRGGVACSASGAPRCTLEDRESARVPLRWGPTCCNETGHVTYLSDVCFAGRHRWVVYGDLSWPGGQDPTTIPAEWHGELLLHNKCHNEGGK